MAEDAELAGVAFVDAQTGWAAGDRGTVWATQDGGVSWKLQASGVRGRLECVFFLDRQRGWIVGGEVDPYTQTTRAILLSTEDGGRKWLNDARTGLPAIRRIHFFDDKQGWALCRPTTVFPTGLFVTTNGGKSWRPAHGPAERTWLDADFFDPNNGVVVGPAGSLMLLRRQTLEPATLPPLGLRNLRGVRFEDPQHGWLVGDGGLVLRTEDYGRSWQAPEGEFPAEAKDVFDWRSVAVSNGGVWIAGAPGTRILHSSDGGRRWEWQPTACSTPLQHVHFLDERRGWAVGSLGAILATTDGGRVWKTQRTGGARAAVLQWVGRPEDLSLEATARLAAQDGYLTAVQLWTRDDASSDADRRDFLEPRLHQAVVEAGGSAASVAWRFPLPWSGVAASPAPTVASWNEIHEGKAFETLRRDLARQLRIWRPEVLIVPPPGEGQECPLNHLLNQAMLTAVEEAADPERHPEQATVGGLAPWTVRRVFASLGPGKPGEIGFEPHQVSLRLGQSFADLAAAPRGLLQRNPGPSPGIWGFQRMSSRQAHDAGGDFFAGLALQPGGEARRKLVPLPPASAAAWRNLAERKRNLDAIISRSRSDANQGVALLGQASQMVRDLDDSRAGLVLFHLAQQFYRGGRWDMAAETFELLVERYPKHPAAGKAAEWLVQYWSSSEAAWRERRRQRMDVQNGVLGRPDGLANLPPLQSATASRLSIDDRQQVDRAARAAAAANWLERFQPPVYYEPRVRFPMASADIRRGLPQQAEKFLVTFRQGRAPDAWTSCADGERWLESKREKLSPKEIWFCDRTLVRPKLDGRLDESFWKEARPACLRSPDGTEPAAPAAVFAAYDDQFLYLGVMCKKTANHPADPAPTGPRPRDPDLTSQDRVSIHLDLDRDWVTAYQLEIDRRGWVRDSVWDDPSWDPTWFVASAELEDRWTAEAAIPVSELTEHSPAPPQVWGVGIFRQIPGEGVQSWTVPVQGVGMQAGCGYLMFR